MNWWQALIATFGSFGFAAVFVLWAAWVTRDRDF